eukprot:9479282-Pyramimonas_sp.AAC.1
MPSIRRGEFAAAGGEIGARRGEFAATGGEISIRRGFGSLQVRLLPATVMFSESQELGSVCVLQAGCGLSLVPRTNP